MSSNGFSIDVDIKRQSLRPYIDDAWQRFFASDGTRDRMLVYLVEVYHYVSHTCPLMSACAPRVHEQFPALHDYLKKHIREETGHEQWVLDDLNNLGLDPDRVASCIPMRETMNLIGCQLYMIQSNIPESYLGYIYTMEGNTASISQLDSLCQTLDIDPAHLRAIYLHARIDIEHHIVDLREWLDANPMDERQQEAVLHNLENSTMNICDLVNAIARMDREELDERLESLGYLQQRSPFSGAVVNAVMT